MLILLHVSIALASIGYTTFLFLFPAAKRFKVAYVLMGATLASGIWLVMSSHSNILSACQTGIAYLAVVSVGMALAHRKLAHAENNAN